MGKRGSFRQRALALTLCAGMTAVMMPAPVQARETSPVHIASYIGQVPSVDGVTWADSVTADLFHSAYDTVTIDSTDGTTYTVEVIPEDLVYFVSAGTGTGYLNQNTQAAVSEPFQAIAALEDGLKNDMSDAAYTEESGWGYVSDSSTYKVSSTVDGGDRPNSYTSTDKYTVGLRDKTGGAAPMTYRFALDAGKYELTTGYHEFYGANRSRDMQPKVTWTDFMGAQQSVEGDLIQLRSADQTGTISFQIDSPGVVSYELSKGSGEAPMFSWIAVRRTGDVEIEAGYNISYLAQVLSGQQDEIREKQDEGYIYIESSLSEYEEAKAAAEELIAGGSQDEAAVKTVLEQLIQVFSKLKTTIHYDSFTGSKGTGTQEWLDNNGEHIQAHGGQVQWLDTLDLDGDGEAEGGWIWYGEDKTRNGRPIDGVRCYTSPDLYNWTSHGTVLWTHDMVPSKLTADESGIEDDLEALENLKQWAGMSEPSGEVSQEDIDMAKAFTEAYKNADGSYDEENLRLAFRNLFSGYCIVERPKMLYNESTGKYVLVYHADGPSDANIAAWLKDNSKSPSRYTRASMGFAVSDTPYGPFELVNVQRMNYVEGYYDSSQGMARDMNVFIDDTDIDKNGVKDAYAIYSSEENRKMYISLLNEDYTGPATEGTQDSMTLGDGTEIQTFAARVLPADSREAPALFKYDGYYYMITSGTSGWSPNQALYYRADNIYGPYEAMGDPCVGDTDRKTFYSQSTCVFPVDAENGTFIYMGDRWLTGSTGSAAWWSSYVWLPVQLNPDHTLSLNPYEDWSLEDTAMVSPVEVTVTEGQEPQLPEKVTLEYFDGRTEERAVTWDLEGISFENSLFQDVLITGTVEDSDVSAAAEVFVVPDHPEYVIDCANPESETFALVQEMAGENLMQETADQAKTDSSTWGYISALGTDIKSKTDTGSGIYDTGWYALGGKDIAYQMLLPAGANKITLGFQDWWGQYENRPMTVYVQTEGGQETKLCDVPSPGQKLVQASGTVELDTESLVTVTVKRAGSRDPILNWITAENLESQEEPSEPVSKTILERFLNEAKGYVADGTVSGLVESVQKLFADAIAKGEAVMEDENATREEVIDAAADLMFAIHALEMKAADKTDLEMALELSEMIDLIKYVEAGQEEFLAAKEAAEAVLADGDAMQAETDEAWNRLVEAMDALRLKADKSVLADLISRMEGLDLTAYTEESVSVFRAAFAAANVILGDETLSVNDQAEVNDAAAVLQAAYDGLEKNQGGDTEDPVPENPDDPVAENPDNPGTDNPGTGDPGADNQNPGGSQGENPSDGDQDQGSGNGQNGNSAQNAASVKPAAKTGDVSGMMPAAGVTLILSLAGAVSALAARRKRR